MESKRIGQPSAVGHVVVFLASEIGSMAVAGVLSLYLTFVNLFLFPLRLTGSRRD